jgi:hypothetical protein
MTTEANGFTITVILAKARIQVVTWPEGPDFRCFEKQLCAPILPPQAGEGDTGFRQNDA